jgi:hypothetical protein
VAHATRMEILCSSTRTGWGVTTREVQQRLLRFFPDDRVATVTEIGTALRDGRRAGRPLPARRQPTTVSVIRPVRPVTSSPGPFNIPFYFLFAIFARAPAMCSVMRRAASAGERVLTSILTAPLTCSYVAV